MKQRFGIVKDKCMAWIMIFTMVLSLVSGLDITPVKADNTEPDGFRAGDVYVTDFSLLINGNEYQFNSSSVSVDKNTQFTLSVQWLLHNNSTLTDNKIRIQLPETLDFSKETGDVYSGGVIIGSYVIENNCLIITKSDDEAWNNNVAGQFQIDGTINPDLIPEYGNDSQTVSIFDKSVTFDIASSNSDSLSVSKSKGSYDVNNGYVFTVNVTSVGTNKGISLYDSLDKPEYMNIDTDSIVIKDKNGNMVSGYSVTDTANGFTLAMPSDYTMINGEQLEITYNAKFSDSYWENTQGFNNKIYAKNSEGKSSNTASSWVQESKSWLNKYGSYNSRDGMVHWTIKVNDGVRFDVSNAVISDTLPDDFAFAGTITIKNSSWQVIDTITPSGNTFTYTFPEGSNDTYTIEYTTSIDMDNIGTQGFDYVNGVDSETNKAVLKLKDNTEYEKQVSVHIPGLPNDTLSKQLTGSKADSTNSAKQVLIWKSIVKVPNASENFTEFYYNDQVDTTVSSTHQLVTGSISVKDSFGNPLSSSLYKITSSSKTGFQIDLLNAVKSLDAGTQIIIEYQTTVETTGLSQWNYIKNYAYLNDHILQKEAGYTYVPGVTKESRGKTNSDGTKFTWHLTVNLNESKVAESDVLYFEDILPENHDYVADSLKAYRDYWGDSTFSSDGILDVTTETVVIDGKEYRKISFAVQKSTVLKSSDNKIYLRYQTEPDNLIEYVNNSQAKQYFNKVSLLDENKDFINSAEASIWDQPSDADKNSILSKTATYSAPMVYYEIKVNTARQQYLDGVSQLTLTDTLGETLAYVDGTVKVYDMDTDTELDASVWSFNYDKSTRTLTFKLPDATACRITYKALVTAPVGTQLDASNASNQVKLFGEQNSSYATSEHLNTVVSESSNQIYEENASVILYKQDMVNANIALSGARYRIRVAYCFREDANGNMKLMEYEDGMLPSYAGPEEKATGSNGTIVFTNIYYDYLYEIEEVTAPEGYKRDDTKKYFYVMGNDSYNGTISYETETQTPGSLIYGLDIEKLLVTGQSINCKDEKMEEPLAQVSISKRIANGVYSGTDSELTGAVLALTYTENEEVKELTSWTTSAVPQKFYVLPDGSSTADSDASSLVPGVTYTLTEKESPKGFVLAAPISFTVNAGGEFTLLSGEGEIVTGGDLQTLIMRDERMISIDKIADDTGLTLSGAELSVTEVDTSGNPAGTLMTHTTDGSVWKLKVTNDGAAGSLKINTTYVLQETVTPSGYATAKNVYFKVNYDGTMSITGVGTFNIVPSDASLDAYLSDNNLRLSMVDHVKIQLTVHKTDKDGDGLNGAVFQLYKKTASGNNAVDFSQTTENVGGRDGVIRYENLTYGDYILKETTAPAGYEIITEETSFSIGGSGANAITINAMEHSAEITVMNNVEAILYGTVTVHKTDEDDSTKKLSGAVFRLTNKEGTDTKTYTAEQITDADGKAAFKDVPYGTYWLEEIQPPVGYEKSTEPQKTEVVIGASTPDFVWNVTNKQLKGNLVIIKKESGTSNVLSGASFKLTNTTTGTVIGTQTTDNSGTATFSGLPYGTYMLEETNAPAYFSIDDESRNIIINGDTLDASNNYSVEVTDTRLSFYIGKTASNKTGQLAGAGLYIKAADGNTQYDGTSYDRNRLITFTTADTVQTFYLGDDPGQYQLKPGKYILVEENAPAGYAVGAEIPFEIQYDSVNDTVKFTTSASNAVVSSNNLTLTMVDEPVGDIMITKRDASIENGVNKPLAGAQFKVYYLKDGNPEYLTTEPQSGYGSYDSISGKYSTNAAGQLRINGLKYNTYYFEEVTAPTGEGVIYVLPASPEAVELNESRFNMVDGTGRKTGVSLDIYNQKKEDQTGTLRLIKKDVSTGDKLSGALFSLYRLDGSERVWINDLESDENGNILFENIKYGNYVLIERTAPKDYQLTQSDSINITVGNASAAVQKVETQNGMEYYFTLDDTTVVDTTSYPLTLNGNNDHTGGLLELTLSNTKKTRDFVIRKAEKDNLSISVEGAQFALYSDNACTIKKYPAGDLTLSSDANGMVTFQGIEYGTYYLKETAPVGFIAQNEPIKVILDDTTEGIYTTESSPFVITNERIKLSFSKKGLGKDTELSGATLVLTNTGEPAIQKIWNTGMITTFRMGTEDEAKYNTDILSAGTYVLREDTAPDGYFAASEITLQINALGEITVVSGSNTAVSGDKHAFTLYDEPYGSVTIIKTDSAGRNYLTGAQFKLYKASDVATVTGLAGPAGKTAVSDGITNALGKLVFEEIPYGDYVIYEVKSPDGYLANETPYTISISRDDASTADVDESNVKLAVSNEKIITTGKITIKKTGEDGDSSGLNGAVFKVFDSQGNEIVSAETRNNGTEDGMVSFTLPYDTYTITEVIAPEGYSLKLKNASGGTGRYQVDETTHSVVVTLDNSNNDVRAVVSDSKLRGTLAIYKGDSKTLLPLAGAKFKLYTNDGDDTVKEVNLIWPTADTAVTQTGTDGYLRIGNLLYGNYILVETDAPENYILPDDETKRTYYITIDSESEKKCIVKNDAKVASLSIRKTETGNDSVSLKDARYELFDATKTNKIASVVTDETGVGVISDIPYGTYYLKEVTPPTDYKLDENWIEINVPVAVDAQPVVVSDARATGKLIIHKSELDQKDMAVTGAEFTLLNKDTTVTRTGITGDDGRIIFTDLLYGTYYLRETTVPEFYSVQEPSYIVEIKKDETHEFIYNRCQYITISKRGTGDITELAGAKLRLKDTSGNIVKEWTTGSEAEKIYFGNASDRILPDTEYILEEVEAPFGYTITSPIHFKTDEDANVEILSVEGNLLDGAAMGNTLVMYDSIDKSSIKKVCLSKKAVGGTEELPGAVITITNSSGTEIVSWTSGNNAKELIAGVKGDLKFDILYSMTEITAPEGYELAESISFRINTDGTIQLVRQNGELSEDGRTLTMRDALTNPSKPDDEGDDEDTPDESIEPKNSVDTGDRTPLTGLIIVLLVSFAVILFFGIRFLRKDKKEEVIIKHDDRFSANQ